MNPARQKNNIPATTIKVVIVEDATWIRENLVKEINKSGGFCCINDYRTAEEALKGIPTDQPDVVLMDINLPGMNGVECIRQLRANTPEVKCLMLTVYEESEKIFNSLLAGASGYLLKRTRTAELLEAIREVRDGGSPMSSSIARKVVAYFHEMGAAKTNTAALTPRELQVLELLAKGMAYKNIADELSLSIETIRMNIRHIYSKLHVHSRGEATVKYLQHSPIRHTPNQKANP
ncbi:MAG TPA: response regulator transcription factor [Candidatus Sulfotelmatobacter sp.]|jgi:DNA-binding NarL/FixJ family response regulator|nr:response regulator transcription factor [Candidatus Sulfotelmatobacter sp.]